MTVSAVAVVVATATPGPAQADAPLCTATSCSFVSPNKTIDCVITVGSKTGVPDSAFCAWSDEQRSQTVRLLPNGVLEPCINPMADRVSRCQSEPLTGAATLGYGQTAALGPFSCVADAYGITCRAAPTGRGFAMSSSGILPVQPPPPPEAPPPGPDAAPAPATEAAPPPGAEAAPPPSAATPEVPPPPTADVPPPGQ